MTVSYRRALLSGAAMIAALSSTAAFAQDQGIAPADDSPTETQDPQEIVVTGIRGSIAKSLALKRDSTGVVDVITAEDIGKLPDNNIAESMSRIPGVQITRRDGEGNQFAIRGLDLNRVEINGRSYIGPTQNATPNLQTLNPEILAGIEVIKSPSANQIEGSLGGTVNLKTRRPFDSIEPLLVSGRIEGAYGDLVRDLSFRGSGLVSVQLTDNFGILAAASYGETKGIAEGFSTGGYRETSANSGIFQPNRIVSQIEARRDRRLTANGAIQWKPDAETEIVVDATYSSFHVDRDLSYFQVLLTPTAALGQTATLTNPSVLADGTLVSGTFNRVTVRPLAYSALTDFDSLNIGATATRNFGGLKLTLDGSYSKGKGNDGGSGAPFTFVFVNSPANTANITYNLASSPIHPDYSLAANYDVRDPSKYQLFSLFDGENRSDNRGYDGRADLKYDFSGRLLRSVSAGFRFEKIELYAQNPQSTPAVNASILAAADKNNDGVIRADELSALRYNYAYSNNFLPGIEGNFPRDFLTGEVDRELGRQNLGVGNPAAAPLSVKDVDQTSYAGYVMVDAGGDLGRMPFKINLGTRYVVTDRTSAGFAGTSNTSPVTPISYQSTFRHFLPSANFSLDLTPNLVFRVSAAKVIARPDLNQVGPGLTLNPVNFSASTGNPFLKPFEAFQKDAALEWYFAPASLLSFAVFQKSVNSFTVQTTSTVSLPIVGVPTNITLSRPENGSDGEVRGFETNYQHALRFLPGFLGNLGVQANYTYADSSTPIVNSLNPAETLPLANLSKNSFNLIGYYEDDLISARVAYSYRDRFLTTVQSKSLGGSIFTDAYGQLDASFSLNANENVRFTIDGTALNRPVMRQYTGTTNRTSLTFINDRRISAGVAVKF